MPERMPNAEGTKVGVLAEQTASLAKVGVDGCVSDLHTDSSSSSSL